MLFYEYYTYHVTGILEDNFSLIVNQLQAVNCLCKSKLGYLKDSNAAAHSVKAPA